jgi:putative flippase GtrA
MTALALPTRFVVVGLICALTHNAILLTTDRWQLHYAIGCALSYLVVVVLGFVLHVRWTFQQSATPAAFWRYALSMAANYPFTLVLLFLMCDIAGLPIIIAGPTATVLMMAWNFIAARWAIVRTPAQPSHPSNSGGSTPTTRPS